MYIRIRIPTSITKLLVEKGGVFIADTSFVREKIEFKILEGLTVMLNPGKLNISKILYNRLVPEGDSMVLEEDVVGNVGRKSVRLKSIEEVGRKARARRVMRMVEENQDYMKWAQIIYDRYRRELLGKRSEPLKPRGRETRLYVKSAMRLLEFCKYSKISEESVLKYVMKIIYNDFTEQGRKVHPAFLISDRLWDNDLPQHIREIVPGFNFDKQGNKERILAKK